MSSEQTQEVVQLKVPIEDIPELVSITLNKLDWHDIRVSERFIAPSKAWDRRK
jgi:hypothetical protein